MTDRNIIQRCIDPNCPRRGDCVSHTLIEEMAVVTQADLDEHGAVIEGSEREIRLPNFAAWTSHAHPAVHAACRLGRGGNWDRVVSEDHTAAQAGDLLADPPIVRWEPMCADCHALLGHGVASHHGSGLGRGGDGGLRVHADHPDFERLSEVAEHHTGTSYRTCERCAPLATECLGCRADLEAERA